MNIIPVPILAMKFQRIVVLGTAAFSPSETSHPGGISVAKPAMNWQGSYCNRNIMK